MREKVLCETFGWDIYQLYRQPSKRLHQFIIAIDEERIMQKEENERIKNETKRI